MKYRAGLALLALVLPLTAWAALGGHATSVQADQAKMKAAVRPGSSLAQYSVHEFQTPDGITIKEFVTNSGTVFAVSWQGPFMPDLQQLLGQYFSNYVNAARSKRGGHHQLTLSQPGLVIHSQGHMRAFSGQAYLPSKLPAGVTPAELQ